MSDQSTEATPETIPHLVIELGGETGVFKAHPDANQMLLARHVDDLFVPGIRSTQAVVVLSLDQVLTEERDRLEGFLTLHGRDAGFSQALYDALDNCWRGSTNLPLEPSSDSSEPSLSDETEQ